VGYSDKETMTGFRTNSICRLLSMSKPVAAVAIMKLIEDGKLAMDDPLSKYLPEWKGGEGGREGGRGRARGGGTGGCSTQLTILPSFYPSSPP